jgi:hypothetical protein
MANRTSFSVASIIAESACVARAWVVAQGQANPQRSRAAGPQAQAWEIQQPQSATPPTQTPENASSTQKLQSKRPPAIRATTRLVQVSGVVHDKRGNPITELTKDDSVVLDEKKPREIRIFSVETNQVPEHAIDETTNLHLGPSTYERLAKEGVTYSKDVPIAPGAVELWLVLRDGTTGTVAAVSIPLAKYFPVETGPTN